jgi:hypothetical protein
MTGVINDRSPLLRVRGTIISVLTRLRFRADFLAWILESLQRSARSKHRDAGIGEIDPALAVGDQHPVRKKEVRAQKHRPQSHRSLQTAAGLTVRRVLPQVGKKDLGILDRFVADSKALEWTEPGIELLAPSPVLAARATTPGVCGVTPSRAASDVASIEVLAPESSSARKGWSLIWTVRTICG